MTSTLTLLLGPVLRDRAVGERLISRMKKQHGLGDFSALGGCGRVDKEPAWAADHPACQRHLTILSIFLVYKDILTIKSISSATCRYISIGRRQISLRQGEAETAGEIDMQSDLEKKAVAVAERIQQEILDSNYLPGTVMGSEPQLCARYGVGRTALREATHLLQFRGLARMRRGPSGGLVVDRPGEGPVVRGLASLISGGRADETLEEARLTLSRVAASLIESRASNSTTPRGRLPRRTGEATSLADLASHTDNSALQGLVAVFEALCHPALGATPQNPKLDSTAQRLESLFATQTAQLFGTSRSAQIARELYARIQFNDCQAIQRLGSEADLCARFAIGIPIARQVVRLLEEAGVLTSQRGRGRGLYLRKPTPEQIRHSIASYLVGCRALGIDCWTVIEALEVQMATSSGLPGTHPHHVSPPGTAAMRFGANTEDIIIGPEVNQRTPNPILVAILEGVRTYSRLRSRERKVNTGLRPQHSKTSGLAVTTPISAREHRPAPAAPMRQKIGPAEPPRPLG